MSRLPSKKKSPLAGNVLDDVDPLATLTSIPEKNDISKSDRITQDSEKKVAISLRIEEALIEEIRDCVDFLSGPPERMTLSLFATEALSELLMKMKNEHRKGNPFPKRGAELRKGRRASS